jgi:hypothetical protein
VPTQKRLRRHDQPQSATRREHPGERSKKGTIGRPQRRPTRLPREHDELMTQHHKLDIFGELTASPSEQQLQDRRESEISEGKEHSTMLPEPTTGRSKTRT